MERVSVTHEPERLALQGARGRIVAAYDPQLLEAAGHRLVDALGAHLRRVESGAGPVLNWNDPATNIADAGRWLDAAESANTAHEARSSGAGGAPPSVDDVTATFTRLVDAVLARGQNLHHPRYIGHQVPASAPIAGLFDALTTVTNQVMAIYEMGPWITACETALIERLGARFGLEPGRFAGLVTHGGSLGNLTALLTARNLVLGNSWEEGVPRTEPAPVLVVHGEAHYCIARSAGVLGLGTKQVVRAALDERRRIDPRRLDETLAELKRNGRPIVAVAACACATPIGAFDPLDAIADVCSKHGVWLHVDAAHGGAAVFSEKHRGLLRGLERADSFVVDAHKMLFVPALCAFVFYRNRDHRFEAFRQDAPYLFDPSAPGIAEHDCGLKTLECTKRAAAIGLWGLWSLFGPQLFGDLVDVTFALARRLYERLRDAPDFETLHEPECNIVAFRHVPERLRAAPPEALGRYQLSVRRRLIESGRFYIVPTQKEGVAALRATVINPLTTEADLEALLEEIRAVGANERVDFSGTT